MRRIAIGITALALLARLIGCTADSPTAPKPGGGGGVANGALQIGLFTSDPNPPAGTCSLIQAIVTLNGANVVDGTGIAFSTNLGAFEQNGKQTITVATSGGSATTSVCSASGGIAKVHASASSQGKSGASDISLAFQLSQSAGVVTSCSPTFGPPAGGTALTLNGGGFTGTAATTRVVFFAGGIAREALVTNVSAGQVNVVTPAFPELTATSTPVQILVTLGLGTSSPTALTAPTCFVYSTAPASTPTVTAVLPSSGKNEGNTRVAIIGSGFVAPVQVFFGSVEATVLSVAYNQIVALSPPATGLGLANQNQLVDVRVHEVNSGKDGTLTGAFQYGPAMRLISFAGANVQPSTGPFTPFTIIGQGFDAPVRVSLAGIVASVISVSATEIVVLPGPTGCTGAGGGVTVTNINTGETVTGLSFTYTGGVGMTITTLSPNQANVPSGGLDIVISGTALLNPIVTFGGASVPVVSSAVDGSSVTVHIPATTAAAPNCGVNPPGTDLAAGLPVDVTVTNSVAGCSVTAAGAFQYLLPCVP
jgi:IPT/TIG domain